MLNIPFFAGETEDDLDQNKKDVRPKRKKNVSGTPSVDSTVVPVVPSLSAATTRPPSAASGTSVTSLDKKDSEEQKKVEDQDGKQTPDSQKSDDKTRYFRTIRICTIRN